MADLTAAGTGAGGLGTPLARWSFVFVWATGAIALMVDGAVVSAPLLWTLTLPLSLAGVLLLTTPGASPLPVVRVVWLPVIALLVAAAAFAAAEGVGDLAALNFAACLVAFLIPRGNLVTGAVGSALLIGASLAWALPQQPDPNALGGLLGIPLGCVVAAVVWRVVLHRIVSGERAHRSAAAVSAERAEAAAEAIAASRTELAAIADMAAPVLRRVAEGSTVDAGLRAEAAHAEAAIRDRIRVPHLQHPPLVAEISRLREQGVAVVLLGESSAPDQLIDPRLADACRTAIAPVTSGRVTIRTFPANRTAAMSVVVQTDDEAVHTRWSAAGELVASG